jgi:3-hydroxyisobutyrate dehydrogenase-like beta-hydroxyacid dehydrogenase
MPDQDRHSDSQSSDASSAAPISSSPPASQLAGSLGIIGLGLLGSALAQRAVSQGISVAGYDLLEVNRQRLVAMGGHSVESVTELAMRSRQILLALPHAGISREVVQSLLPTISPGAMIIDATTGDPEEMRATGELLRTVGIDYADATVSGSSEQAKHGDAVFLVGCSEKNYERVSPLLRALAREVLHVGQCGDGAKMKLITNLVLGLNRAALAEGLVLAKRLDIAPEDALAALRVSMAYSSIMDTKGEKMVRGDFRPQARLSQHLKDVRLMLDAGQRSGQPLPLTDAHRRLLEFAESLGLGPLDNSAIMEAIEQLARGAAS